ncbi:MAG: PAS domain S-box protein, partial [Syntrophobacteraceae bacterium]
MQDEDKSKEQLITELRELRKRVAELDLVGKRQVRTSATDITERAKQTREIEHLNRLYSVLSRVSQAVVRATSPETFLEQACREIVEAGGFLLAWIGQVELMTNAVVPKAFWGGIGEYVQGITVYADSRPEGLGPTGTCIREHYPVVHNDFLHDPQTLPWHDRAAPFGIASAAAFPIERAGGVWGALTIYSDEVDRFGGEDAKLLEKVADDIEFALDNLDREFRRKQAEEALLESENKFKSFAEQAITGINIIQDGVFKYVNPKCAQMFGYSVEECLNDMPFKNLVYAEDLAEVEEQIRRRTSGETESVHYTFRGLKKNGQIFPMEIYGSAIVYKGRPAATGTILDITERKRAEEALRKSEGKYRQIVETANEGICMADVDYLFTYVNQKMADMLGYLAEEIIGKPLVHFLFPEDLANHQEKRSHRIEGLNETYERRFRRSDGGESWTKVSATVIRTEDGRFMGSFAMLTDITEHKRAEMALRESDVRLKIAMDLARLVQWEYDVKNGMFSFDDQFYALYGTTSQYEGGPMMTAEAYARKFIPPEESHVVTEEIAKTLATNDPNFTNQLEHRIIRADGEERHIIVRYGVICDQTGSIVKIRGANQDITERKNGEKALHESELRLRTILQTVNEGFWLIDNDTVTMDLNPRMCAILGRNPEEVLGRKTFDFVDSEYKAIFEQQIRLRAQGEVGTYEIALSRPDGSNVFCLFNASPLFDGSGNKVGSFAMVTDITERKRAQDELFNSRQMLRSVLDNIPQRVFWKDRNSVFLGCNKPLAMDAGYEDPNELVGKTDYEHASAATADLFRADDREVMESARPKMNYEEPQIRPDGSQAWLITSKVPMYDRDGQVIGVLGTYADITERKLMEEEIRQTNAYLENIFENSPDGIGIVDNHGRFIRWNKMAEDLTGYTFEEMKGKSGFDVYADKGELGKMLMSLRREGSVKKWEMRTVRKDGSIISLEISIALLKDSQNETIGSVCIARDLSSIKETLAALKASHERLYQESADRKRAAEELKDSEQLLKSIIQGYPIPTFMIGKDHRVIHWNRSLEELTGVGASVVIGTSQHWRAFYREERPCMADLLVNENQEAIVRWYGERAGKSEILDEAYKATQFFPDLGETGKWLNFTAAAVR